MTSERTSPHIGLLGVAVLAAVLATSSGCQQRQLRLHERDVNAVAFSRDGRRLASASDDKSAVIWDLETDAPIHVLSEHGSRVLCLAWSPDGTLLATGTGKQESAVKLWNVKTGQRLRELRGHSDDVRSVAFRNDGAVLASVSRNQELFVWNVEDGTLLRQLSGFDFVVFSHGGELLAARGVKNRVHCWNGRTFEPLGAVLLPAGEVLVAMGFDRDDQLVSVSSNGLIRVWDPVAGVELYSASIAGGEVARLRHFSRRATVDAGCQRVGFGGNAYTPTSVWNVRSDTRVFHLPKVRGRVNGIAFHPDGRLVAFATGRMGMKFIIPPSQPDARAVFLYELEPSQ